MSIYVRWVLFSLVTTFAAPTSLPTSATAAHQVYLLCLEATGGGPAPGVRYPTIGSRSWPLSPMMLFSLLCGEATVAADPCVRRQLHTTCVLVAKAARRGIARSSTTLGRWCSGSWPRRIVCAMHHGRLGGAGGGAAGERKQVMMDTARTMRSIFGVPVTLAIVPPSFLTVTFPSSSLSLLVFLTGAAPSSSSSRLGASPHLPCGRRQGGLLRLPWSSGPPPCLNKCEFHVYVYPNRNRIWLLSRIPRVISNIIQRIEFEL